MSIAQSAKKKKIEMENITMETIIKSLEKQIPPGSWCNNGGREDWCPYFEVKKQTFSKEGLIRSYFCHLLEEYITRKVCGINEEINNVKNNPIPRKSKPRI